MCFLKISSSNFSRCDTLDSDLGASLSDSNSEEDFGFYSVLSTEAADWSSLSRNSSFWNYLIMPDVTYWYSEQFSRSTSEQFSGSTSRISLIVGS